MDVRKSYNPLYRGICLEILRVYGLGTKLQILLQRFWDEQDIFPKSRRFYRRTFGMYRGVTQGLPVSPTVFNVVLESVVRDVVLEVCGYQ